MFEKHPITSISITTDTMVRAVIIFLCVFLLWFLRDLVLIILTAIVIASFIESTVPYFKKIGINRVFGIAIFYIVSLLTLAGVFYLFAPLLITEIYNFSTFISSYIPNVSFLNYFQNKEFSGAKDIVNSLGNNFSIGTLFSVSKAFILNLSGGFFQALAVAFGSIFTFSYLSGGISAALMVTGAYLIIHQFEVFLFAPVLIKKIVGLSPIVIILSALIGFELGGFWGLVLSIPIAVVVMEFLSDVEKNKILARTGNK